MSDIRERGEREAAAAETAACEAVGPDLGALFGPCGQPSAGLYRRICVHEHVADGHLCREHAERLGAGRCRVCFALGGGLSHECPISVALVTA